jgi:hypothetical protein
MHTLQYRTVQKLFLINHLSAEHSLCEGVTVLPRQVMGGSAVKKWHKRKNTAVEGYEIRGECDECICLNYQRQNT